MSEQAKHEEVSEAERNEAFETHKGSRRVSIVAPESRETDPREPVSSQGGTPGYRTAIGKHKMKHGVSY